MTLHTFNSQSMSLRSINLLHFTDSEVHPGRDFFGQGHYSVVKGQILVIP